ncbi:unnamed protein product [Effrenium voratum]|nr:unnamed protein product [Effrenium voratum]
MVFSMGLREVLAFRMRNLGDKVARGDGAAKKRKKWQEESDEEDESEAACVTVEEMEEWKAECWRCWAMGSEPVDILRKIRKNQRRLATRFTWMRSWRACLPAARDGVAVGDLKKRLFWSGGALPEGHLEKAELVKAVEQAEAEKARRFAAQEEKRQQEAQGVLRPEPRPLDFETVPLADHEKQIVELHLLTEDELVDKILENGHDAPYDASKHYLVALCRKALKDPRAPKPKRERKVVEERRRERRSREPSGPPLGTACRCGTRRS